MIPLAIIIPIVLGWLRLQGEYLGLYRVEFGIALFAISMSFAFIALTWKVVKFLEEEEIKRNPRSRSARLRIAEKIA